MTERLGAPSFPLTRPVHSTGRDQRRWDRLKAGYCGHTVPSARLVYMLHLRGNPEYPLLRGSCEYLRSRTPPRRGRRTIQRQVLLGEDSRGVGRTKPVSNRCENTTHGFTKRKKRKEETGVSGYRRNGFLPRSLFLSASLRYPSVMPSLFSLRSRLPRVRNQLSILCGRLDQYGSAEGCNSSNLARRKCERFFGVRFELFLFCLAYSVTLLRTTETFEAFTNSGNLGNKHPRIR